MTDEIEAIAAKLSEDARTAMMGAADADMPASVAMKLSLELRLLRPCLKRLSVREIASHTYDMLPTGLCAYVNGRGAQAELDRRRSLIPANSKPGVDQ